MKIFKAAIFEHYCLGGCDGEVLKTENGMARLRRIRVEVLPGKYRLFDSMKSARDWAAKSSGMVNYGR